MYSFTIQKLVNTTKAEQSSLYILPDTDKAVKYKQYSKSTAIFFKVMHALSPAITNEAEMLNKHLESSGVVRQLLLVGNLFSTTLTLETLVATSRLASVTLAHLS